MNRIHFTTARAIESLPDTRFAANDGAFGRQVNCKSARKGTYCNRSTGSAIWWHKTRVKGPPNHKKSEQIVGKQYGSVYLYFNFDMVYNYYVRKIRRQAIILCSTT